MGTDSRIGAVLDNRYRIVSMVATGSMGVIYRGERLKLGRSVAIKLLHTPLANQDRFLQRFEVEARALSRLSHPNCVSIIDFGVADAPYLVMEYIPGRTLKQVIDQRPLPAPRALHIFRQVLAGLAHAHGHGIVHRDIKPGNVMLTEATGTGDHIRILDFGLAKLHNAAMVEDETGSAKVIGTPAYMSPEQASGKEGDVRSDLYSAGVVLFEMLTGQKPFDSEEMLEVLSMQVDHSPPLLRSAAQGHKFSEELEALVHKALAKKPDHRFQTALELSAALDKTPEAALPLHRFYGQSKQSKAEGTGELRAAPGGSRRGTRVALLLVLAAVVVSVAAWMLWSQDRGPRRRAGGAGSPTPGPVRGGPDLGALRSPDAAQATADLSQTDAPAVEEEDAEPEAAATGLHRVSELIKAGRKPDAIDELRRLRLHSRSPYIDYMLGKLYFDRHWWSEGMRHYRAAIRGNPAYRRRHPLIRDVISALLDDRTAALAEQIIVRDIGKPALPYLSHVARNHSQAKMRLRAGRMVTRLR